MKRICGLEVENSRISKQSELNSKQGPNITGKVNIKPTSFGMHLLKKTGNKILHDARIESKNAQIAGEEFLDGKIEELKKLRENIAVLTPKTISSNCIILFNLS